ncbi:MAG: D-alanine--D-alanine ligase [Spirochaetales bacterium]|nr:D-alanine--D-alanine ligase [Spirochaetales bacterium]
MARKLNVGILFGGKSAEHEVSLQSAKNVYDALDRNKYNPVLIGIDKNGKWLLHRDADFLLNADNPALICLKDNGSNVSLAPESRGQITGEGLSLAGDSVDVVLPILHGPLGEDGTVQGLLKLADIPFAGAGVLGSAIGMDKDVMKRLLRDAGIRIADFITVRKGGQTPLFADAEAHLGNPLFIKPANMGSSVGVSKVHNEAEYDRAIDEAFRFDRKLIIEECIRGREIECSVLGNREPIASVPGEVIPSHDFYSYEAKYIDEKGAVLRIPADLKKETSEKVRATAIKTFLVLECEGMARVDSFLTENNEITVNEINTLPGFTRISMYPKLWEASGIRYSELIDRLITLAIERYNEERTLRTDHF